MHMHTVGISVKSPVIDSIAMTTTCFRVSVFISPQIPAVVTVMSSANTAKINK